MSYLVSKLCRGTMCRAGGGGIATDFRLRIWLKKNSRFGQKKTLKLTGWSVSTRWPKRVLCASRMSGKNKFLDLAGSLIWRTTTEQWTRGTLNPSGGRLRLFTPKD